MKRWASPAVAMIGALVLVWLAVRSFRGHAVVMRSGEVAAQPGERAIPAQFVKAPPARMPPASPLPPIQIPTVIDPYAAQHDRLLTQVGATPEERERAALVWLHAAEVRERLHREMQRCLGGWGQSYCQAMSHEGAVDLVKREHAELVGAIGKDKADRLTSAAAHEFDAELQKRHDAMIRDGSWRQHFKKATPAELELSPKRPTP